MIESITFSGINGTTFNLNDDNSPLHNFDSSVDFRTDETLRVQDHGLWETFSYMGARTIVFEGDLIGNTVQDLFSRRRSIFGACIPTPELGNRKVGTLSIDYVGLPETVTIDVYMDGYPSMPLNANFPAICPYQIGFKAFDPFFYGTTVYEAHSGAPGQFGGRTYPKTFNRTYTFSGAGGQLALTVGGDAPTRPTIILYGAMVAPTVTFVKESVSYSLKFPGLTISAGDFITIDTTTHTILNGQGASIYDALDPTSDWFRLYPGDNEVNITASFASSASDGVIQWNNVYMPS